MRKISALLASVGSCCIAVAPPAVAQEAVPQAEASARVDPVPGASSESNEIIVTARKRDERLQDVPIAISALSGKALERWGIGSVQGLTTTVPQLVIGESPGGGAINLRGVGSTANSAFIDQAVALNIDGVQISKSFAITLGMFDLDRIEVLKGPQSLFFGKSTVGGVISLVSAAPGKEFEWRVRAGYEIANQQKLIEAVVSTPLTDTLGLRLAGSLSDQVGWFRNRGNNPANGTRGSSSYADEREALIRGTLKYESPDSALDATLRVSYAQNERDNGFLAGNQLYSCPLGVPQSSIGVTGIVPDCTLDRYSYETDPSPALAALVPESIPQGRLFTSNKQLLGSLTVNADLTPVLALTSVTGYYRSDFSGAGDSSNGYVQIGVSAVSVETQQFSQELRLASKLDSPVNFVAGMYYERSKTEQSAQAPAAGFFAALFGFNTPVMLLDEQDEVKTTAVSAFGQAIWDVTPTVQLTGGARYSHEEKHAKSRSGPAVFSGFTSGPIPLVDNSLKFNNLSPQIDVRYRPNSALTFYASYRTGFNSGGFNLSNLSIFAPNDVAFRPAKVSGFEGGVKASAFDRQLRFDLSAYTYLYKDLQLSQYDPVNSALFIRNAGKARVSGAEFAATFNPASVSGLIVNGTVSYNRARYLEYNAAGCYTGQTIAQGCTGNVRFGAATSQDLSGSELERAPEWAFQFGGAYDHEMAGANHVRLAADYAYTDRYQSSAEHDPRAVQASAWRLNGSLNLYNADNGWEVGLIGRNLTNVLRAANSYSTFTGFGTGTNGPSLGTDLSGSVTEPRTILLQLTFHGGRR